MADLKLAKLPDRTPVKRTISIQPTLHKRLLEYTAMYNEEHKGDEPEELEELIPYMLDAFLDSDRAFARRLKQLGKTSINATLPTESRAAAR